MDQAAGDVATSLSVPVRGSTDVALTLHVNGSAKRLQLDSRVTLLDALRDHLAGRQAGCGAGAERYRHALHRLTTVTYNVVRLVILRSESFWVAGCD